MTATARGPWLQPFNGDPKPRCPKCLAEAAQTEWHDTVVVGMCKERRDAIVAMSDTPEDIPDEFTEHLCRACFCGYWWSEHIASPADMARIKAATSYDD